MTKDEELDLALEALEGVVKNCWRDIPSWRLDEIKERITAIKQARSVPVQEPVEVDQATMELAESVGLIGPASRTHDLHAAIQRFHDLICVNATIKAAKMAADAIRESNPPVEPMQNRSALTLDRPMTFGGCPFCGSQSCIAGRCKLNTTPPAAQRQWVDPNDKTQEQYLPHIGEPVLFCHEGKTYMGKHTGGSFQSEVTNQYFNTWFCHWMYLPAAHGIKEKP